VNEPNGKRRGSGQCADVADVDAVDTCTERRRELRDERWWRIHGYGDRAPLGFRNADAEAYGKDERFTVTDSPTDVSVRLIVP
jgi:hypothetical protein